MKLHLPNKLATIAIIKILKGRHCISRTTFIETFFNARQNGPKPLGDNNGVWSVPIDHFSQISNQNWLTVESFLLDNRLIEIKHVGAICVIAATKRLIHTEDFSKFGL